MAENQEFRGEPEKIDIGVGGLADGAVFDPEGRLKVDGNGVKVDQALSRRSPEDGKALSGENIRFGPVGVNDGQETVAAEFRVKPDEGPKRQGMCQGWENHPYKHQTKTSRFFHKPSRNHRFHNRSILIDLPTAVHEGSRFRTICEPLNL